VHALELDACGERRLDVLQVIDQPRGDQLILDGGEPRRAFGMRGAHVVQQAVAMGQEGDGHVRPNDE
jgi:hypothetical protein